MKYYWRRFNNIEKGLVVFLGIGIFIGILNEDFLNTIIPKEISGYLFWLSLGLYLGFRLCRYEYIRVWKLLKKDEKENNKNIPFSPN